MLSLFPQLFTYQELAPFILRLAAGFIAVSFGYPSLFKPSERLRFTFGIANCCAGVLLLVGFLTQLAAIFAILATILEPYLLGTEKKYRFQIILIAVLVALMLLGPGLFSIDLPL